MDFPPRSGGLRSERSCRHADADLAHVCTRLDRGAIAKGCVQALPIMEYLDVVEHRRFGLLAGAEVNRPGCAGG